MIFSTVGTRKTTDTLRTLSLKSAPSDDHSLADLKVPFLMPISWPCKLTDVIQQQRHPPRRGLFAVCHLGRRQARHGDARRLLRPLLQLWRRRGRLRHAGILLAAALLGLDGLHTLGRQRLVVCQLNSVLRQNSYY